MADSFMLVHRGTVISLTARNKVPAIGSDFPVFAREGGLSHMDRTSRRFFAKRLPISIAFCAERTRVTFRCRGQPSTSW